MEIIRALALLEEWTGKTGREILADKNAEPLSLVIRGHLLEKSNHGVKILKAREAYRAYREMLLYYGVKTLMEFFDAGRREGHIKNILDLQKAHPENVSFEWVNLGGQLVPEHKAAILRKAIGEGALSTWKMIHGEYEKLHREYPEDRALNALQCLRFLAESETASPFINGEQWNSFIRRALDIRSYIEEQVYKTRLKDYTNPFRIITYRNTAERDAVLGNINDNLFIKTIREEGLVFKSLAAASLIQP
jgi:hypothetical protein